MIPKRSQKNQISLKTTITSTQKEVEYQCVSKQFSTKQQGWKQRRKMFLHTLLKDCSSFSNCSRRVKYRLRFLKKSHDIQKQFMQQQDQLMNILDALNTDKYAQRINKQKKKLQKNISEKNKIIVLQQKSQIKPRPNIPVKDINTQTFDPLNQNLNINTIRYLVFATWSGKLTKGYLGSDYKFKLSGSTASLIKHTLQENGFIETTDNDSMIIWFNGVVRPQTYASLSAYQKINHFPKSFQITRKDLLFHNISKMQHRFGRNQFQFIPKTYVLPQDWSQFLADSQKSKNKKTYIIKPHNSSQGRGIWITNNVEEIVKRQKDCSVVSHYIQKPLLLNGFKFDLRIYVAITSVVPLRIYIYEEGLGRFATYQYTTNTSNLYSHLTNYSLNKYSDKFVANQDCDQGNKGSKWTLKAIKIELEKHGHNPELIWQRIKDMIIKTIISIENTLYSALEMQVPYRDNCFQLLGVDVLIDQSLRPWLLQINLCPSLNTDSALDLMVKGNLIADLFSMIGIVPIDQRFSLDKSYLMNEIKAYSKDYHKTDFNRRQYTKYERHIIDETREEYKRRRNFIRIFPESNAVNYKKYFDVDRHLNSLLRHVIGVSNKQAYRQELLRNK